MARPGCVGGNEGDINLRFLRGRELYLGLLRGLIEALERQGVVAHVEAALFLKFAREPIDDPLVDVLAAQVRVAVGRARLYRALLRAPHHDLKDRYVKGPSAKVEYDDLLVFLFVKSVRKRRRGRLVDDALDLKSRDAPRVARRGALGVVKVRGDGDDRLGYSLAE